MPLTKQFIDKVRAKYGAMPVPSEDEIADMRSLIKTSPEKFTKAVQCGEIVDLTDMLGADNTYRSKEIIKSHGGYFGSLLSHWYIQASRVGNLMAEINGREVRWVEPIEPESLQYRLSGEVDIEAWSDSERGAIDAYNEEIEKRNNSLDEENQLPYIDRVSYSCWEQLGDGITRYQWVNPTRNHGMVYLETMEATRRDGI